MQVWAENYFQWNTKGGGNGIKGTEEGGGNLHEGGQKSLKRGAEIIKEGGGNQTEVVGRSILFWA